MRRWHGAWDIGAQNTFTGKPPAFPQRISTIGQGPKFSPNTILLLQRMPVWGWGPEGKWKSYLKRKNKIKIMGKGTKLYRFVCKTGSWIATKIPPRTHQNSPYWDRKPKFFLTGEGDCAPFPSEKGDTPSPYPTPSVPQSSRSTLCSSKLTLKKP